MEELFCLNKCLRQRPMLWRNEQFRWHLEIIRWICACVYFWWTKHVFAGLFLFVERRCHQLTDLSSDCSSWDRSRSWHREFSSPFCLPPTQSSNPIGRSRGGISTLPCFPAQNTDLIKMIDFDYLLSRTEEQESCFVTSIGWGQAVAAEFSAKSNSSKHASTHQQHNSLETSRVFHLSSAGELRYGSTLSPWIEKDNLTHVKKGLSVRIGRLSAHEDDHP